LRDYARMDPKELLEKVFELYKYCNELNDSFQRYKNNAKYLYDIVKKIENFYRVSENSWKEVPEILLKFYEYYIRYKVEVEKIKKKFMKRLWYLKHNEDKMKAFEEELEFLVKQLNIENLMTSDDTNKVTKNILSEVRQLQENIQKLSEEKEKNRKDEIIEQKKKVQKYFDNTLNDPEKLYQEMLKEKVVVDG
ncbi:hypothetical protein PIROE2DRAFT_4620, partial [Piromyces sp. E2]